MKSSLFLLLSLGLLATIALVRADEDDVEIEAPEDEELEIEEDEDMEIDDSDASGVIDPSARAGRIISRKKVLTKNLAAGQPMEIEYTIWNLGNTDVVDVDLVDDSFSAEEYQVSKRVQIHVASITAGGKHVETHTLVPKSEGKLKMSPAKVTYKSGAEGQDLTQFTSDGATDGIVPIDSAQNFARNIASHYFDWICFIVLAAPSTILPYVAAKNTLSRYGSKVKSS